jgi:hypothetical protein
MLFSRKVVRGLISTTVAAAALAVPAVSSADTPVPPLQAGDTQAYPSLTAGGPVITSPIVRQYRGSLDVDYFPTVVACSTTLTSTINPDGTAAVTQATFVLGCSPTGFSFGSSCYAIVTAPSGTPGLSWGGRLVRDSSGTFRLRINVQKFTIKWPGSCAYVPTGTPFTAGGVLSPQVTPGWNATSSGLKFAKTSGVMHWDGGDNGFYPYLAGSLFTIAGEPLFPGV